MPYTKVDVTYTRIRYLAGTHPASFRQKFKLLPSLSLRSTSKGGGGCSRQHDLRSSDFFRVATPRAIISTLHAYFHLDAGRGRLSSTPTSQ